MHDAEITPGQVLFRGVPPGRHFIAYRRPGQSPLFVENRESRIESVDKHVGREASPAAEGTQIRVSAGFLAPWVTANQLEIFSERAYMDRRSRASAGQPNAPIPGDDGATEWTLTLDEMSDPYGRFTPLIDASENDDLALFVSDVVRPNEAL